MAEEEQKALLLMGRTAKAGQRLRKLNAWRE